jgi:opacity protein-like surface antigen
MNKCSSAILSSRNVLAKCCWIVLMMFFSEMIFASGIKSHTPGNWYVSADIGATWSDVNGSMTLNNGSNFPSPSNVDRYSAGSGDARALLGVSAGYRWQRNEQILPAYSAAFRYQHLFTQPITGTVDQYSLPQFINYYYSWGMEADVMSLYSKIDLINYKNFMPYVDAGLGVSLNRSTTYHESAFANVTPRVSPMFASQTRAQFAYNIGAGLDVQIKPQVIVSLGYEYQSFGHLSSGSGQTTWSGTHLSLGNLATNTVLLGATYVFDGQFISNQNKGLK